MGVQCPEELLDTRIYQKAACDIENAFPRAGSLMLLCPARF